MENSSKDVDYDEETKITSGISQKNSVSRKSSSRNSSNVAESKDRDRENPPSPSKEIEKEEPSAPKSRRKRNEGTNASVSGGGGWMSTSSGLSNGKHLVIQALLLFTFIFCI